MFTAFVVALLLGLYFLTAARLNAETDAFTSAEFEAISQAYNRGGRDEAIAAVSARAAAGGPGLYGLFGADNVYQAGNLRGLPKAPAQILAPFSFRYSPSEPDERMINRTARGRMGRLLDEPTLVVARDMGGTQSLFRRMSGLLFTGLLAGLLLSFLVGYYTSRAAAVRIGEIAGAARQVMRGDLTVRTPVGQAGDEFDELASHINAMLDQLQRMVETIRTTGDAIAHDLRSPLARLRLQLEAPLNAPPDSAADRAALAKALAECERVIGTFNAILKLSRLQAAENWTFHATDITELVTELGEFYAAAADEKGVAFELEVGPGLIVQGDRQLIVQALANLLENALKYVAPGGRIHVTAAQRADRRLVLAVSDDGPGVPVADRQRIRERFVRLEAARTTLGAGLGLALVEAVARLHKGVLEIDDGLARAGGHGLRAALVLPRG